VEASYAPTNQYYQIQNVYRPPIPTGYGSAYPASPYYQTAYPSYGGYAPAWQYPAYGAGYPYPAYGWPSGYPQAYGYPAPTGTAQATWWRQW
jgi:hypothetical protein